MPRVKLGRVPGGRLREERTNTRKPTGRECMRVAVAIAQHLSSRPTELDSVDASLGGGLSGISLFLHYVSRYSDVAAFGRVGADFLDAAVAAAASIAMAPGLLTGYCGVGWTVAHLERTRLSRARTDLTELDDALIARLELRFPDEAHDLVYGLAGFGVYFLERSRDSSAAARGLELVLDALLERSEAVPEGLRWHTPPEHLGPARRRAYANGLYDLGFAHGVPGIVAVAAAALRERFEQHRAAQIAQGGAAWLLAQIGSARSPSKFPHWLAPDSLATPHVSRVGWCYGDLGPGYSLIVAGNALRDEMTSAAGLSTVRGAVNRPASRTGVVDACLCHGSAGIHVLLNRASMRAADEAAAKRRWLDDILSRRVVGQGCGGYSYAHVEEEATTMLAEPGFLVGSAGIGLALLSAAKRRPLGWERAVAP